MTRFNALILTMAIAGLPAIVLIVQVVEPAWRLVVGGALYLVLLMVAGLIVRIRDGKPDPDAPARRVDPWD
jgi:hypothetical protein